MKKITYNNKQYVLNDPQYPVEETVTDADMNEIKEVVNFNADETLEENIKIKEQLEQTKDALINITTEKSSNINVKDSSNLNAKIGVFGISEQETREGYNLLNVASSYEITGSKTVPISMSAGNYTIKADDITTDSEQTQFCFSFRNSSGTIADARISLSTKKITFALTREATSVVIYSGNSFNESQGVTTTYKNLMIYEGADDKTYEEYGASPSPEFPSEIENITGNIDITVCNKNIFNKENYDALSDYAVQMEGNMSSYKGKLLQLKPNTTYAVSRLINNFDASGSWVLRILDADKVTPLAILQELSYTSDIKVTITTRETGIIYIAELYATDERLEDFFSKCEIQIEENNSSTDFIPHKEQTITFPLSEGQKLYKGDYLANDGIHHVRKQIELDGTENWFQNETTKVFGFALSDIKTEGAFNSSAKIVVMSSYFKAAKYYQLYYGEVDEAISGHDSSHAVELRATRFTTIEELKTWLAQQKTNGTPVIVEYELTEEEIEPYTKEQQEAYNKLQNVLSYYNVTNVFTDNALLEFKYIADTQTWVVNEIKPLKEQLNTINQLLSTTGTSATLLDNLQKDLESEVL